MANVLVSERGDTHGLASALASYTPADGRAGDRPPGRSGSSGSRASSRRPARVSRWPAASARSTRRAPSCAPRSTSSTSSRATSARRCGSAPISPMADGYAALAELAQAMDGGEVAVAAGARRQPGLHPAQVQRVRRAIRRRSASRSPPRCTWTRPPPSATCCCPSITRSSGGTTLRPRAGVYGLMQPVMEPVFNTLPAGEILLRVSQEGRRRAGQVHCAQLGGAPQDPLAGAGGGAGRGRRGRRSGTARCSAAACIGSRRRRRRSPSCSRAGRRRLHQAHVRGGRRASPS